MQYSIQQIANMAGVSTRTLRYYDNIGLLTPAQVTQAGYRIYESRQVDRLQQILLYRQMGMPLGKIKEALQRPEFNRLETLESQLVALEEKHKTLERMIGMVKKSIDDEKGVYKMKDTEKFEGLKRAMVEENDRQYGEEIIQKYGEDEVNASKAKFMRLTEEEVRTMEELGTEILDMLGEAVREKADPAGQMGLEIAKKHRAWLDFTWTSYTPQAHLGLARMYVDDARFAAYYDKVQPGGAQFLHDAVAAYVNSQA